MSRGALTTGVHRLAPVGAFCFVVSVAWVGLSREPVPWLGATWSHLVNTSALFTRSVSVWREYRWEFLPESGVIWQPVERTMTGTLPYPGGSRSQRLYRRWHHARNSTVTEEQLRWCSSELRRRAEAASHSGWRAIRLRALGREAGAATGRRTFWPSATERDWSEGQTSVIYEEAF